LLRGALVLAVGALDALVADSLAEAIPIAAKNGALGAKVQDWTKKHPKEVLGCFAESDPTAALGDLFRTQLSAVTFQKAQVIEDYLATVLGADAPWPRAATSLATNGQKCSDSSVKARLDEHVQRRIRIAHTGDLKEGSDRAQPIKLKDVEDALRLIRAVGTGVIDSIDEASRGAQRPAVRSRGRTRPPAAVTETTPAVFDTLDVHYLEASDEMVDDGADLRPAMNLAAPEERPMAVGD
jgi:hypothetical protein